MAALPKEEWTLARCWLYLSDYGLKLLSHQEIIE